MSIKKSTPRPSEKGQAIIIIIFAIVGLIGMSALAIDGTNAYADSRRAETAASAAALTAALTRIEGGDWRAAALSIAATNGYNNDGETNMVELNTPPLSGPYVGNAEYIEVIITSRLQTYFANVIGIPFITTVATAVSQSKPSVLGAMFPGYALVSLAPRSECEVISGTRRPAFWIHAEATINLEGGGLFVNSNNPNCAFISFGSGSVRVRDDSSRITVVGGADIQKPQLITPFPIQTGAPYIPYPPPYQLPKIGCSKDAVVDETTGTMTAGGWGEDIFPPENVTSLESGIYCIDGDFIMGGGQTLTGNNVLLVIDGAVDISNNAYINLSAPSGGNYQGLLIYMPIENKNTITLSGTADSSYRGAILAPGANVRITGLNSFDGGAFHSQIIGYFIEVAGIDNIYIRYKDEQNYDTFTMPEVVLGQ
jgi:hypothetical protein